MGHDAANPADGSVRWIAVLFNGASGMTAAVADLARVTLSARQQADVKERISG